MSNQNPTNEALDEQERKLARIVRALPGGEPPAALDARILKAAANAAASSRRPGTRWLASTGALWGISSAAAAVLALGISWHLLYPTQRSLPSAAAPAAKMADQAEDSTVSVELKDRQAVPIQNSPLAAPAITGATPASRARATGMAAQAPPPGAPMPEPFAADQLDEHVAARAEGGASAEAAGPPPMLSGKVDSAAAAGQAMPTAKATAVAEPQLSQRAAQPPGAASADAAKERANATEAASPEPMRLKPANWLAHVRQLRDENRTIEASASLREFHKRYPDFVIPSDLAPLLRE